MSPLSSENLVFEVPGGQHLAAFSCLFWVSKRRRNGKAPKWLPNGFQDPSWDPLGSPRARPGSKHGPKRLPRGVPRGAQNDPKIVFLSVLGRRGEKREPRSSPKGSRGTPRGSKLTQNGSKIDPEMEPKLNQQSRAACREIWSKPSSTEIRRKLALPS